jgi:hypothetical protein
MNDSDSELVAAELCSPQEEHFYETLAARSLVLQDGFKFWNSLHRDGAFPRRSDFNPFDVPSLMPNMLLFEVQDRPRDFRYRVIGTTVSEHFFTNWTGHWMSEIDHQKPPSRVWDTCDRVASTRHPILGKVPYVGPNSEFIYSEDLILPLVNDQDEVVNLLIFLSYIRKE